MVADHNGMYGIELNGGANKAVHDSDGVYGIWVTGSNGALIVNSTGKSNGLAGLYVGSAPSGAVGARCTTAATSSNVVVKLGQYENNTGAAAIGLGVDTGNLAEQIGLNVITGNQTTDAVDANASCGLNLWFFDTLTTTSQSGIH